MSTSFKIEPRTNPLTKGDLSKIRNTSHGLIQSIHENSDFQAFSMIKGESTGYDYLNAVSKFIKFLSENELTLDEILRHLVLVVFYPLHAEAIYLRELDSDNRAVRTATWGMPPEMILEQSAVFNFNDKYPSNDAIRLGKSVWINTLPDWGDEYPLLKDFPYTTGAKGYVSFPISRAGTPVAALSFFCRDALHPSAEMEEFLRIIGSVFSLHMFMQASKE